MITIVTRLYGFYGLWLRRANPLLRDKHKILVDAYSPNATMFCLHSLGQIGRVLPTGVRVFFFGKGNSRNNGHRHACRKSPQYVSPTSHNCKPLVIPPGTDKIPA